MGWILNWPCDWVYRVAYRLHYSIIATVIIQFQETRQSKIKFELWFPASEPSITSWLILENLRFFSIILLMFLASELFLFYRWKSRPTLDIEILFVVLICSSSKLSTSASSGWSDSRLAARLILVFAFELLNDFTSCICILLLFGTSPGEAFEVERIV